ncbi:glycoside hydrolase family 32 protein [Ruania alba]|uniref:beta-fructofuranosidase n=1 Tax=Ruania alba TaxID=648782 RepID=A0A1H5ENP0_9MICO|nr:glycoside hydrolase family 32 protein [Ruania alba]SED92755.1 beta-fructofuranosidase [Ruania alba]
MTVTTTLAPFPHLHVRPPQGWVNDPNGIGFFDDRWHVFYQYNPDAPVHADICWGLATSPDLVTWTDEPVALRPRAGTIDAAGVWSGVATVADGEPVLVYTAVPDDPANAGMALARREDGTWRAAESFAAPPPADPDLREVRDPFLVTVADRRYAIVGGGRTDGTPLVLVYDATDLEHWTLLGELLTGTNRIASELALAQIWECPQLVRLPGTGTWALIVSLWHDEPGVPQLDGVTVLLGDLDTTGPHPQFVPNGGHRLDSGPDFYAPQALAHEGRVLLWGWTWEGRDRPQAEIDAAGWAGCLTFPRELTAEGTQVRSAPAAELTALRRRPLPQDAELTIEVPAWEIETRGAVHLTLTGAAGDREIWSAPADADHVRVLVDGSVIEAFVDGVATTLRAYPQAGECWQIEASSAVTGWELGPPTP